MALETIRNVLGQIALRGLQERSAAGQADLMGQRLRNELMARQMDELFPLQVENLRKQIDFMLSPEESMQHAINEMTAKEKIREDTQKAIDQFQQEQQRITTGQRITQEFREQRATTAQRIAAEHGPMSEERFRQEATLRAISHGPGGGSTPRTSPTVLKELYQTQVGRVDSKGEVVEQPSDELTAVRAAMEGTRKKEVFGIGLPGTSEVKTSAPEFFQRLVFSGFPDAPIYRKLGSPQTIRNTYPGLVAAVEQWRYSITNQGPSESSLQMSEPTPDANTITAPDGTQWQRNPDGTLTRIK